MQIEEIAIIKLSVYMLLHAFSSICVAHVCFRLLSPKPKRLSDVEPYAVVTPGKCKGKKIIVVVTGGCGLVGSAIIRQLIQTKKYVVISLDNRAPSKSLKVENVTYNICDITSKPKTIAKLLENTDAVIHTAGVVCLSDEKNVD